MSNAAEPDRATVSGIASAEPKIYVSTGFSHLMPAATDAPNAPIAPRAAVAGTRMS